MDNLNNTNRCTSSVESVREKCRRASSEPNYDVSTMEWVAKARWKNSPIQLMKSGCFSTGKDELHCTECHTQTLCNEPLRDASYQTLNELLDQPACCIHHLHSRECVSYTQWLNDANAMFSQSIPKFSLPSAGAESQIPVTSINNVARATAARPETSFPSIGPQVAVSGNQSDSPALSALRTRILTTDVPFSMNNPAYPLCTTTDRRLRTFNNWPSTLPQEMPRTLAMAGFLYTGESDYTRCFCCNIKMYNWEAADNPFVEHARWRTECEWLRQEKGQAFINEVQELQQTFNLAPRQAYNTTNKASHSNFDCVEDRLTTFRLTILRIGSLCSIEKAQDIACAGFFLLTEVDDLCCFFCDGKIPEWRAIQDFAGVHLNRYPECQFIKHLSDPLVAAVVGSGRHTNDCVLEALRKYRNQYPGLAIDQHRLEFLVTSIETATSQRSAPAAEASQGAYDYDQVCMATPAAQALLAFQFSRTQILKAIHEMDPENTMNARTLQAEKILDRIIAQEKQNSTH